MAEVIARESATPVSVAPSPVQTLAESSVVDYAKPQSVTPAPTTTQTIAMTAAAQPVSIADSPLTTSKPLESKPQVMADTRPTSQTNNILMIDPSLGIGSGLGINKGTSGGGGGGAMPSDVSAKGVAKRNWWPVILMVTGGLIIGSKLLKKKAD